MRLRGSRFFRSYPRLDCAGWLARASDAWLFAVIAEGGEPFGMQAVMAPFAGVLSQREIADLVAYLRRSTATGASE